MRIIEKGCDPSIKLAKFKFNCDECDKSIPNPLPQNLNHFMMIVGKPGSSKTTLIMNMICKRGKMYNKKFDRIYLFSPSLGTITTARRWERSTAAIFMISSLCGSEHQRRSRCSIVR